jgi:hypothetical protein
MKILTWLLFFVFVVPSFVGAEEILVWMDKDGIMNISNIKPQGKVKLINIETYTPDSPEEIEAFNRQRKYKQYLIDAEERRGRAMADWESRHNEYKRSIENYSDNYKKEREISNREKQEDLQIRKDRLQAIENRDYKEARRLRLKEDKQYIDREINDIRNK